MPQYDLSTIGAVSTAAELARIRANQERDPNCYNAAWLHGYASALADCAEQLEPQQEFLDAVIGYLGEQHDSTELYEILHDRFDLPNKKIKDLGFDLPQCAEPRPQPNKTTRRKPSYER